MGLGLPFRSAPSPLLRPSHRSQHFSCHRGMPPPPPPPPPALMEELIEEILLRLPPDEPASLFRASLVCKPWCRLIFGPRFRRRYREFHRSPPMLGFLCGRRASDGAQTTRFVPTSAFCSPLAELRCHLLDARHGRVLLKRYPAGMDPIFLVVWDPITDEQREIPMPKLTGSVLTWNAAVVCAAAAGGGACDHLDCHRGPFLVVFVVSCSALTFIWTYSSDVGSWSDPISTQEHDDCVHFFFPGVLVGNALYFEFVSMKKALKYDLEFHEMSVVGLPPSTSFFGRPIVLTTTEDSRLGLATVHESKLYMWSRKDGAEADAVWTRDRVIELETLLSSNFIPIVPGLVGFVEWVGVIFLRARDFLFTVDLNMLKVKKVYDGRGIYKVIPYMSFCTPALGGVLRGEGPSAGVSSA